MSTLVELHHPTSHSRPAARHLSLVADSSASRAASTSRQRPAVQPGVHSPALRLTVRGRRVVRMLIGTALVVFVAAGVLLLHPAAQAGDQARPMPAVYHVVLPGETLWQLAGEVAPGVDRRDTVAEIVELNALPSAAVTAGQRIALPSTP